MAATARSPRTPAKPKGSPRRPLPPSRPAGEAPVIIGIPVPADGEEQPEPERVPLFQVGDQMYYMLKEPPYDLGLESLDVADRKGGAGYAEIFVIKTMIGSEALNALFDARKKGWLKKPQFDAIMKRVSDAVYGALEDDSPNR